MFIGDRTSVGKFLAIRNECPLVKTVLQTEGIPWDRAISLHASLESVDKNATFKSVRQDWRIPSLTYFTSGTSGPPKMVQHNQISFPLGMNCLELCQIPQTDRISAHKHRKVLVSTCARKSILEYGRTR